MLETTKVLGKNNKDIRDKFFKFFKFFFNELSSTTGVLRLTISLCSEKE